LAVRIVIGGPPNSGKSTLAESLASGLRQLGVDAYAEDLDLASPTLEFIRGAKGWGQRVGAKQEWTPELADEAAKKFEDASKKHAVVIGDAPGKITGESEKIASKANYALILCREDRKEGIERWQEFFQRLGISVVGIFISKLAGAGNVEKKDVIRATVIGLNRTLKTDEVVLSLAALIKEELRL